MAPPYGKKFAYVTGNCGNGWHEGTRPRNYKDQPLPVCVERLLCTCKCHKDLDAMFEMTEQVRIEVPNPEYRPAPAPQFIIPTREELVLSRTDAASGSARLERVAPGLPADVVTGAAPTVTPTGKRSPGQLERQVKEACDMWLTGDMEGAPDLLTMKVISDYIGPDDDNKYASVGAIQAVLERWVKYGFASMGTKPVRFTGYTAAGMAEGLDSLRLKWQDKQRRKP